MTRDSVPLRPVTVRQVVTQDQNPQVTALPTPSRPLRPADRNLTARHGTESYTARPAEIRHPSTPSHSVPTPSGTRSDDSVPRPPS